MARVTWDNEERLVASIGDLDALLDELHAEAVRGQPILVSVERSDNADSLSIGLGRDVSVLNYVSATGDPPYFSTCGGPLEDRTVHFMFMGDWSEFPLKNTIPLEAARRAMRHFWQTGALSPDVEWEEV